MATSSSLKQRGTRRPRTGPSLPAHLSNLVPTTDTGAAARAQYGTPDLDLISERVKVRMASSQGILPFFIPKIDLDEYYNFEGCCEPCLEPRIGLEHMAQHHDYCLLVLAWAIQNKVEPQCIKTYLDSYDASTVRLDLSLVGDYSMLESRWPILYFAIEANSPEIVRILCKAGADPNPVLSTLPFDSRPPLAILAYTVLSAENSLLDTTDTLLALLAMGADPAQIPRDMWDDYLATPRRDSPSKDVGSFEGKDGGDPVWCTTEVRHALCRTLNLMQRYALWKAGNTPRPTPRALQCAEAWGMLPLFEVPFHIIGQQQSTQLVQKSILSHRLFESDTPLVFLFTGPSGHGKTELARRMGDLLSLDILSIDCTEMRMETDIFGPKAPYQGSAAGTPLNNHLATWTGQRAVVFLDEYDKTTADVRNSMLLLFESGDYKDRRNHKQLDCSKIIWVLAANFGVEIITKFWTGNLKGRNLEQQEKAPLKTLETSLKAHVLSKIGAPVTGRISEIVPFFPFNQDEQAVTAYKFMRQIWNSVRAPIDTGLKWFPGHSFVNYIDDGRVATCLAKEGYNPDLGARSLQCAVVRHVQRGLAAAFFGEAGEISDAMNVGPLTNYDVRVVSVGSDVDEVEVKCNGTRSIQERPVALRELLPPTPVSPASSASSEL